MPVAQHILEAMTRASWIRKMFEKGTELKRIHGDANVFDFTLGNPILEPPKEFFDALVELARLRKDGIHRYMPNAGIPAVREAIARRLSGDGTFPGLTANHVVMSVGAGGGLNVTLKALLNPGEQVLILAPYFVEYMFYIRNHGGEPTVAETKADFDLDPAAIAAALTPKTKAVIVNSPNNPSGRLYPRASLDAFCRVLSAKEKEYGHPIYVLSDEPYRELVYSGGAPPSPAALHPNSLMVYSWSKSLSVPGERIGYVAVNPKADSPGAIADALNFTTRILGFVNAPASMQWIVAKLLSVTIDVNWYRTRRDRLVEALRDMGFDLVTPEGTFYLFPKSPDPDDLAFVNRALEERVLLVPGAGFGRKGHFRICYCVDDATIEGGIQALRRVMAKR
ncbi:MAG: pyridoxal phosphate-dependent aminotransferase [Planctomycetes bacterium]|jgi:aspartate aminotransferase|nr:pyridoxal phosphate-dependent aminotransferase [Planctomycetota bacterium]